MKTAISSSGVSVSGSVGSQKGSVGVGSNGSVNLGIDTAGVKLGVTNDYGGAGTIGFGGQSVTWGTTGGKSQFGIGGFELIVEARDCVVVETKKIAGMTVSRRSYPDPGCKKLPQVPSSSSGGSQIDKNIGFPSEEIAPLLLNNDLYHVVFLWHTWIDTEFIWNPDPNIFVRDSVAADIHGQGVWLNNQVRFYATKVNPLPYARTPAYLEFHEPPNVAANQSWNFPQEFTKYKANFKAWASINGNLQIVIPGGYRYNQQMLFPWHLTNTGAYIKDYIQNWKPAGQIWDISVYRMPSPFGSGSPTRVTPTLFSAPPTSLSPSAGNQPPMPESCCESLKADLEDIKEVLATKEMLGKKLTFPWRLRMPGGEGDEVIMDYPNLARAIAQMIDHLGIHPPKLSIKDINNAVAGDQSIENQFPSGTQAFEALMAQVWDANADVDTLTNFLYRLSWLCVQQSMNLARVSGDIQCIKDMVGGETEPQESSITTPFNVGAGIEEKATPTKGKGFGKKPGGTIDKSIEANTELSTENLLPDFLKIRENPVIVQTFTGNKDIFDLLSIIVLKLEGLQNR